MVLVQRLVLISFLFLSALLVKAEDTLEQDLAIANRISKAFSKVAEKAFPSVVVIENIQTPKGMMGPGGGIPPELEFFFGRPRNLKPQEQSEGKPRPVGFGSGVIIRDNGYVVTNQHVIAGAEYIRVKLQDGTIYDNYANKEAVKVVGIDEQSDVAILKLAVGDKPFKALNFSNSDEVAIGDWAIAVGAPFNYDYTMTVGIVSQKGRHNVFKNRVVENYIQTDASINPGNSGGPLLNIKGEIIGINNFIANGSGVASSAGLGFAISSNIVKSVSEQIISNGKVSRPWLGIMMSDLTPNERKNFSIEKGVLVKEVIKGNPAEKAGLQSGDVILKVGANECNSAYDVQSAVLKFKSGEVISLTILRNQKEQVIKITSVLRDEKVELAKGEGAPLKELGLSLREADGSLFIQAVDEESEAFEKGLKPGMKIVSVNRVAVTSVEEFQKVIKDSKGESIMLKLNHNNKEFIEFLSVR